MVEPVIKTNLFIVTGAPGVGKSTLISELSKTHNTESEPAREVIAEQRACNGNGLWEKERALFVRLLLSRAIEKWNRAPTDSPTFFDRGIPDNIAYAACGGLDLTDFKLAAGKNRYHHRVFILPPWKQIYKTDEERKMSFDEVIKFHEKIVEAYTALKYELVTVPALSVADRATFILNHLDRPARTPSSSTESGTHA